MVKIYERELHFLEQCLRMNPKCYSTWHQRCWIMDKMETPDWKQELALCNKFLEYDERNCKNHSADNFTKFLATNNIVFLAVWDITEILITNLLVLFLLPLLNFSRLIIFDTLLLIL